MNAAVWHLAVLVGLAPALTAGLPLRYAFKPGQRLVYAQSYRSSSRSDARALFQEGSEGAANASLVMDLQMDLRGRMRVEVVGEDGQGFLLLVRWEGLRGRVNANGQPQPAFLAAIQRGLGQPLLARLDGRGAVTRVWLDPKLDAPVQGTARLLIAELQCVLPEAGEAAWQTLETDTAGSFEVRYERLPGAPGKGLVSIQKTFGRHHPRVAKPIASDLPVEREVQVEGSRRIQFDARAGRLERADAHETQRTRIARKLVAVTDTVFSLQRARTEVSDLTAAKETAAAIQQQFPGTDLFVELSPQEQEEAVQRKELGTATVAELLPALQAAEARGETDGRSYYLKLKALAALRADACMVMGQQLATVDPEGLTMHVLASVLGATGSPSAQAALAAAIRRRREDWPAQMVLLPALGQCADPVPDAIALLEELAFNSMQVPVASTAQLMLGTMAFNLARQGAPQKAEPIVAAALSRLEHADTLPLASRYLLCLGNAGSVMALPALKTWAATPEPELRALAVFALRWIEDPDADRIILQALGSDQAPEVRLKAVEALKFRRPAEPVAAALQRAVGADASPRVRLAALGSLWDLRATYPAVTTTVEAALKDPDEDVRNLAGSLLGKK